MKRITAVLAVFLVLGLAQASQSADLRAGWYTIVDSVNIYSYMEGSGQVYLRGGAGFYDTPPGQYGPFVVTRGGSQFDYTRHISVPTDAWGIGPDQSLVLPMEFGMTVGDRIAYLSMGIGAYYDSSQMYLQMWRKHADGGQDELLWEHKQSGQGGFSGNIAHNTVFTGQYYFRVNVVPEPSGLVCLLLGATSAIGFAKRRR